MSGTKNNGLNTQYPAIPALGDPYRISRLEPDERELIDYLYHIHRGLSRALNQSERVLLKRIPELNTYLRENPNRNHARILNKLLSDGTAEGSRSMMLYPLVEQDPDTGGIDFSIRFVVSFEQEGPGSVGAQIEMMRECNASILEGILGEMFDRPRRVAMSHEERPGLLLGADGEGAVPDYRVLSAERTVTHRLDAQLETLGLKHEYFALFFEDVKRFCAGEGRLKEFFPGLWLPAREDIFAHDEIVFCYRVTADALETFTRNRAPALGLNSAFARLDQEFPAEAGRRQKRERVLALLEMLEGRPGGTGSGPFARLDEFIGLVRELTLEMGRGFEKQAREEVLRKVTDLFNAIRERAAQSFDTMKIIPDEIFSERTFKDPAERSRHAGEVLDRLRENQELAYVDREDALYFVHLPLLFRIEAELERRGDPELAERVRDLIAVLPQLRPGTRSYKEILRDYDPELYKESLKILNADELKKNAARDSTRREIQRQIKLSSHLAGGISIFGGAALYGSLSEFDPLVALNVVLFSYLAGFGLTYSLLNNRHDPARKRKPDTSTGSSTFDGASRERQSTLDTLFPAEANVTARIYSRPKFMERIGELEEARALPEGDPRRDAVESILRDLQPKVVMLTVPRKKVPAGHEATYVLDRRDVMASSRRAQIVAHFREKSATARKTGNWTPELAEYYDFLAGQVEASFLKQSRRAPVRRG